MRLGRDTAAASRRRRAAAAPGPYALPATTSLCAELERCVEARSGRRGSVLSSLLFRVQVDGHDETV